MVELADVTALQLREMVYAIKRLEGKLIQDKLPRPIETYIMNWNFIDRVVVKDWDLYGGVSLHDWLMMNEHKAMIESLLNA